MAGMKTCAVVGIGPGNGAAFARRFSRAGYQLALLSRSTELSEQLATELGNARAYSCDVTSAEQIQASFAKIRAELGDVDALLYNAGSGSWGSVEDVTPEQFETAWRINALGGLLCAREVLGPMKQKGHGNIVFVGATASRRGGAGALAFASAKAAQKHLAESLARHLWPHGVHVSLLIVDGVIDLPRTRKLMADKPDSFFLKPADIAETVYAVTEQARSAWSFEVEARPFAEKW
jgi:NAD(P)-dependent dehydrogenase (short-subunit alcohol dehydrogenase family)